MQASLAKLREATPDGEPLFGGKLHEPTRDHAPVPEDVRAHDGEALVSRTEAATAYVALTMPMESEVPRMPSAKIRIAAAMDPRQQVTQRALRGQIGGAGLIDPEPGAAAILRADADVPPHALPATIAPATIAPPTSLDAPPALRTPRRQEPANKRLVIVLGTAAMIVLGLVLLLRAPSPGSGKVAGAGAVQLSPPSPTTGRAVPSTPATTPAAAAAAASIDATARLAAVPPPPANALAPTGATPIATTTPKGQKLKPEPTAAPATAPPVAPTAPPTQPFDPLMNE